MLKPDYYKREISENYKVGSGYGNDYFEGTKSRGIFELLLNGVVVRIIPPYGLQKYTFLPNEEELEKIHESDRDFKSMDERRFYSFYTADIVFYVNDSRAGESFRHNMEQHAIDPLFTCVVHCITPETYTILSKEIRINLPIAHSDLNIQTMHLRKEDLIKYKLVCFLDETLPKISNLLTDDMKASLGLGTPL
jgi:hypothetical protein